MDEQESSSRPHKRHKRNRGTEEPVKLHRYAALGEHRKLEKLLHKHASAVGATDFEGSTALHQAARHGHQDIVDLLLSVGADCKAQDFRGNTPAHIAASCGHLQLLSHLLKVRGAPDVVQQNASGQSIEDLAEVYMLKAELADRQAASPSASPPREGGPSGSVWWDQADEDQEGEAHAWEQRLQDEALGGGAEAHVDDWYMYEDGSYFDGPQPVAGEDEDAYAQRIWEEMTGRKHGAHFAHFAQTGLGKSGTEEEPMIGPKPASAAERKAQAAEEARERSDRILEEERAKDRAWRQAVLMGDVTAQRARYDARWATFIAQKAAARLLSFKDIPWLADDLSHADRIKSLVLHGTNGTKEARKRLQAELMRWHPDKFTAHWTNRLLPADRQQILDKVSATSQVLTGLLSIS